MKIKVCGLKDMQNIKEVIALQPDWIGFVFYPHSKRYLGDDSGLATFIKAIDQVKKVGVFVDEQPEVMLRKVATYGLDVVQLHGQESPDSCRNLAGQLPVWKAFSIAERFDFGLLSAYQPYCQHFLFDTPSPHYGGSGKSFDWRLLHKESIHLPFLLSGGIAAGDITKIKRFHHPLLEGVDVNSRFEVQPGLKDTKLLNTFIHELRN